MTLPPLNFSASAASSARLDQAGNSWDFGQGDWNVNLAGSGYSMQSGSSTMVLIAVAVLGGLWILRK